MPGRRTPRPGAQTRAHLRDEPTRATHARLLTLRPLHKQPTSRPLNVKQPTPRPSAKSPRLAPFNLKHPTPRPNLNLNLKQKGSATHTPARGPGG